MRIALSEAHQLNLRGILMEGGSFCATQRVLVGVSFLVLKGRCGEGND